jgi:putative ABC transport system permease protein
MIIEQWLLDLRLACRRLGRAKGFTGAAVLALAVGIAGTTVMFALIQGVLLRPLPVHEQDRLVVAWKELRSSGFAHYPFGDVEIEGVAEASQLFERVAGVTRNGVGRWVTVEDGFSSYVNGALVTGSFFDVLGIEPVLGRSLTRSDDLDGAENVLVISHGLWQRRYGGSRDVIGRRVTLSERPFSIVGVMPPDVDYPNGVEAWRTTSSVPSPGTFGEAARREVDLIARLRPGVTLAQATGELTALTRRFEADAPPNAQRGLIPIVRSFEEVVVGDVRSAIVALFGAVGLVLLIASANAANLLLMRSEARRPEFAVCAALGAGRGRIVRQLFAESLVLALAAGAVGLAVTWWSLQALMTLVPDRLPRVDSVRIDVTVVLFTIAIALVTAGLAGLAPALSLVRADLASQLRSGGRGVTGSAARHGRRLLVVAQVALAVTIVAAAGLLMRSLLRLQSVDIGLDADHLVFVDLALPQAKYGDSVRHARFLDEVTSQLQAVPAIAAATPVNVPPFSGIQGWDVPTFTAEGQSADRAAMNWSLNLESVHPNYFETFGVTLARGRAFTDADRQGVPDVAIVSEDVAESAWPGQDPIGKRLKMGGPDSRDPWRTIVGVATLTRYRDLTEPRATLYLPAAQFLMTAQMLALRTTASLDLVALLARDRIRDVDPAVRVMRIAAFAEMLDRPLARPRFNAFILSIFGIAALLLATIGLYAVMSAYVRQRDAEIGIRVALGATAADVRRLVVGEGLQLAGVGAAIGLASAVAATRLLGGLLFEVDPLDPATLLAAALLLMAASALACYLPARRATRVDPVVMLRTD